MSVEAAKAKLDKQAGDPEAGYITALDVQESYDLLEAAWLGDTGTVVGPESATADAFVRFDSTTGRLVKDSQTTEDDSGNVTIAGTVNTLTLSAGGGAESVGVGKNLSMGTAVSATALGDPATATGPRSTAIGHNAGATSTSATAVGAESLARGNSTALGSFTDATDNATAIGAAVQALGNGSVAIGVDSAGTSASTSTDDEIVLGTALHTVDIPGDATVDGALDVGGFLTVDNGAAHSRIEVIGTDGFFKANANEGAWVQASSGGWSRGYRLANSASSNMGGYGGYGVGDTLSYLWIGTDYNTAGLLVYPNGDVKTRGDLDVTGDATVSGSTGLTVDGGNLFLKRTGAANTGIYIRADVGYTSDVRLQTGSANRWIMSRSANSENLNFSRYPAGSLVANALSLDIDTGDATFEADVTVGGTVTIGDTVLDSDTAGYLNTSDGYRTTSNILVPSGSVRVGSGLKAGIESGTTTTQTRIRGGEIELGTDGPTITTGTGTPEGVVTAPVGSRYTRTDGDTLGDIEYVKLSGAGNTGWVPGPACDTGARDLGGETMLNGWTATEFALRRVGQIVTVALNADATSATTDTAYTLPVGFGTDMPGDASMNISVLYLLSGDARFGQINSARKIRIYSYAPGGFNLQVTYTTDDAWPTSLPGTAA